MVATEQPVSPDHPLLVRRGLPPFDRIDPGHIVPAVRHVLREATAQLEALERDVRPTWDALTPPLDAISRRFEEMGTPAMRGWTPDRFAAYVREENATWVPLVRSLNIRE